MKRWLNSAGFQRLVMGIAFCCLSALSLEAQSRLSGIIPSFRGGILTFPDNGNLPDPAPVLPSFGLAADMGLVGPLRLETSLDFYGTDYDYSYDLDRAVPASIEYRTSFVVGSVLGIQALGRFDLSDRVSLRVFGGPAADIRICFLSYNLREDAVDENTGRRLTQVTEDIAAYFWERGRWFLPTAGFGLEARILPKVMLGFDARAWFPLYRLWSGEDLAPLEGWRFSAGLRVSLR